MLNLTKLKPPKSFHVRQPGRNFDDPSFGKDIYKALALSANVPGITARSAKPFSASVAKEQVVAEVSASDAATAAPQPKANALS